MMIVMRANALRNQTAEKDAPRGAPPAVTAQSGLQCPFISGIGRTHTGQLSAL